MIKKPKANSVVRSSIAGRTIMFTVEGAGTLILNMDNISEENQQYAMLHGLVQRIQDAAALPFNYEENRRATPQEKFEAMRRIVEHLGSGAKEWNLVRVGGAGGGSEGFLLRALYEIKAGVDRERVKEWYKKLSAQQRAALSNSDEVRPVIERLRAETGKKVDVAGILGELDSLDSEDSED